MSDRVRLQAFVSGRVQGVGFRAWTRDEARRLGLAGAAVNLPDGRVEVVAEGPRVDCEALLAQLHGDTPPGSVTSVETVWSDPEGLTGFTAG
ncbi:acylphosphatase [Jatrophihabitans endophyticus]|uniref:acylphosphatase n=1 Tax=Jatrophihabitans endophyticus TaxID=1206085 RepID=A0A1M5ECS1_9ACTN|nr:acylphosphatase [Jatrophihabitans endophyticus]SHF76995.1 acylphosphatase [Jatrophihabitans endophyticus]